MVCQMSPSATRTIAIVEAETVRNSVMRVAVTLKRGLAVCAIIALASLLLTTAVRAAGGNVTVPGTASDPSDVSGSGPVDSGISVTAGQVIAFSNATGTAFFCTGAMGATGPGCPSGPSGNPGPDDCDGRCPLPSASHGALLYRIGNGPYHRAVTGDGGNGNTVVADTTGELTLIVNDNVGDYHDNSGGYTVGVAAIPPTATPYPTFTPQPTYTLVPSETYTPPPTAMPYPTYTPVPTYTVVPPTATPYPTYTPRPTYTIAPSTATPYPTYTPRPTYTPVPSRRTRPTSTNRHTTILYFAGAQNNATMYTTLTVRHPGRARDVVQLTLLFTDKDSRTVPLALTSAVYQVIPLANVARHRGPFGLLIAAHDPIEAYLTLGSVGHGVDAVINSASPRRRWTLTRGYSRLGSGESLTILNPDVQHVARALVRIRARNGQTANLFVVVPSRAERIIATGRSLPGVPVSIVAISDRPVIIVHSRVSRY